MQEWESEVPLSYTRLSFFSERLAECSFKKAFNLLSLSALMKCLPA